LRYAIDKKPISYQPIRFFPNDFEDSENKETDETTITNLSTELNKEWAKIDTIVDYKSPQDTEIPTPTVEITYLDECESKLNSGIIYTH
jgi:hypothetical protein